MSDFNDALIGAAQIEKNSFNDDVFRKAGFSSSFICLLRPDNYISYISENFNKDELNLFLANFLTNYSL